MKLVSKALLAAGLVALSACGGGEENVAANNTVDELYNVAPDDLGAEDLLGNETLGNDTVLDNALTNDSSGDNSAAGNSSGNTL